MASFCPECDNPIVVDSEQVEEGETVQCDDCGAELEVVSLDPVELKPLDDPGYVEEDELRRTDEDEE